MLRYLFYFCRALPPKTCEQLHRYSVTGSTCLCHSVNEGDHFKLNILLAWVSVWVSLVKVTLAIWRVYLPLTLHKQGGSCQDTLIYFCRALSWKGSFQFRVSTCRCHSVNKGLHVKVHLLLWRALPPKRCQQFRVSTCRCHSINKGVHVKVHLLLWRALPPKRCQQFRVSTCRCHSVNEGVKIEWNVLFVSRAFARGTWTN